MDDYRFDDECLEEDDNRAEMELLDDVFDHTADLLRAGLFTVVPLAAAHFAADTAEEVLSVSADREDANDRSRRDAEWLEEAAWTLNDLTFEYLELRLPKEQKTSDAVRYAWDGLSRSAGGAEQDRTAQQERRSLLQKCWS